MSVRARRRLERWSVASLVVALAGIASPAGAPAQDYVRLDGTVQWMAGQTLTIELDAQPGPPAYVISGQYLLPVPAPRPTVEVDLSRLRQAEYSFLRLGERLAVIGFASEDRRRLIATSLIRGPDLQSP
jgi:hypothetical protein